MKKTGAKSSQFIPIFVVAWLVCVLFYFIQYGLRSAPGIMVADISATLGIGRESTTSIIGLYFYTYALFALVSVAALDRVGPRFVAPSGILLLALGSVLFGLGLSTTAGAGRLLQGAGSGVAFTSAVFLATRGFPQAWLATAVGVTQCIGMLGGSLGQAAVAPIIHSLLTWQQFWFVAGGLLVLIAMASLAVTPRLESSKPVWRAASWRGIFSPYKVVLSNPQSYLCGIVAGLMFMPTNIADMIWGIQFLEDGLKVPYEQAANRVAMVPLGWVIGCPLLGYLADYMGRRKPVLIGGALAMLLFGAMIVYLPPGSLPPYLLGLLFGIASGAAMIPYTIIKEVNPDRVKGSATGAINFIVFGFSAVMTPLIGSLIKQLSGAEELTLAVFREADLIYVIGLILAVVLACFIRETGSRSAPEVPLEP